MPRLSAVGRWFTGLAVAPAAPFQTGFVAGERSSPVHRHRLGLAPTRGGLEPGGNGRTGRRSGRRHAPHRARAWFHSSSGKPGSRTAVQLRGRRAAWWPPRSARQLRRRHATDARSLSVAGWIRRRIPAGGRDRHRPALERDGEPVEADRGDGNPVVDPGLRHYPQPRLHSGFGAAAQGPARLAG